MPRQKNAKTVIAEDYLTRFPNSPTKTLSNKMYVENRIAFNDTEDARSTLRRLRGQAGEASRKDKSNPHLKVNDKPQFNPFKLPQSSAVHMEPFKLPKGCDNILMISDLHIPYHDIDAITAALQYGKKNKINCVFINGDLLDFFQLSRFQKSPGKRSVAEEFDAARAILQIIRKTFPKAPIFWLEGNHDTRYRQWLYVKAPEIFDVADFQMEKILGLDELGVTLIDEKVLVKMGKLNVSHGHHIIRGVFAPVNAARGVFMQAKASMIIGHCHAVSEHTEKNVEGDITTTWSTGCLCELRPDYTPLVNKYAHGFAHITVAGNGNYKVKNHRIFKGEIL